MAANGSRSSAAGNSFPSRRALNKNNGIALAMLLRCDQR
jgi:hypothetical protein